MASYTITNLDSRLKDYLAASKDELIGKAIFDSQSAKLFTLQTGVKSDTAINLLDSTVTFRNGKSCSFEAGGSDTLTDRILAPAFIEVDKTFCPKDFLETWKSSDVRMAATHQGDSMPFEEAILTQNIKVINAEVDKLLWVGDKTNGTGNMALLDGIYTMAQADITSGAIPAGNVIAKSTDNLWTRVKKLWVALPAAISDKCTIVMSISNYKNFIVEMANSNMYHIFEQYDGEYRMRLPYANIDVIGVAGLEGVDAIFAMPLDEVFYGCDLENDQEEIDLFYSKDDRNFKMIVAFAVAVNYAFPANVYVNQ